MENADSISLNTAFELFTRSAKSFPDSYLAGKCHQYRAILLDRMGDTTATKEEEKRVKEYYPVFQHQD